MTCMWARTILSPPEKKKKKSTEEKLGEAVGKVIKDEGFGETLGKYLKENAERGELSGGAVNINIHLNHSSEQSKQ